MLLATGCISWFISRRGMSRSCYVDGTCALSELQRRGRGVSFPPAEVGLAIPLDGDAAVPLPAVQ